MVRRRQNPMDELRRKFPHKAFIRREDPLRSRDSAELTAACQRIAGDAGFFSYAGSRGDEIGCRVIGFDTLEKARAAQTWIDASGIADRPRPEPPPGLKQLKVGR